MSETVSFKCPNCGSPLKYSAEQGLFACEFCDSTFTFDEVKDADVNAEQPFDWGDYAANVPEEHLDGMVSYVCRSCGAEVVKLTVPTVFVRSVETVVNAIRSEKPDAVLMIGQAGGRSAVSVERVAININSASIADNEGNRPIEELIEQDAPAAYFSTLPIVRIVDAIRAEGVPAVISNTAAPSSAISSCTACSTI